MNEAPPMVQGRLHRALSPELTRLSNALGHDFEQPEWLLQALTHRSFGHPNNERLEFLGDSILNTVVAMGLFARFETLTEGELSRLRAQLVRQSTLHELALKLEMGQALRLGEGELRSGGHERPSILADALEALLGAVFLDAGFEKTQAVIGHLYAPLLEALDAHDVRKDPKTRLQEWLQARHKPLPIYTVSATYGEDHARRFEVLCALPALKREALGQGSSRRAAEQAAARALLAQLGQEGTCLTPPS
jgi:ribonuclease III